MEERLEHFYNTYPNLDKEVVKRHFYINECKFCSHDIEKRNLEISKSILEGISVKSSDKSSDKSLDKSSDKSCDVGVLKKEKKGLRNLVGKLNIKKKYKRMFTNRVDVHTDTNEDIDDNLDL